MENNNGYVQISKTRELRFFNVAILMPLSFKIEFSIRSVNGSFSERRYTLEIINRYSLKLDGELHDPNLEIKMTNERGHFEHFCSRLEEILGIPWETLVRYGQFFNEGRREEIKSKSKIFLLRNKGGIAVAIEKSAEKALGLIEAEDQKRPEGLRGLMTVNITSRELEEFSEEGMVIFKP